MNSSTLINQTSGDTEYYTPKAIIEAARIALGGRIDLDPASSERANAVVGATQFFTEDDDGLSKTWNCRTLWMNHPFGRVENPQWIQKLLAEWFAGRKSTVRGITNSACCITYACTSEEWFRPLLQHPQCFLYPRTNYVLPSGAVKRGVTKGSVVTYLGDNIDLFRGAFALLGAIKI